jgi:hypothetical protein
VETEDERHFMLTCEEYETDRKEMWLEIGELCEEGGIWRKGQEGMKTR